MTYPQGRKAAQVYGSMAVSTSVESATPHRLVQMLMQGALEKIIAARGHMMQGNIAGKGENIGSAISIVEGLRASLDSEQGGEIARNLNDLYEYMARRLLEANARNDASILDEVSGHLRMIKAAWDGIESEGTKTAQPAEQASEPLVSVGV